MAQLRRILGAAALLAGLYLTSLHSYLLFHSLVELFSIVIACGIFLVGWHSRQFLKHSYLMLLGVAYLFVGGFDALHTLAYSGMGVFPGTGANLPTQLWIASRLLESVSLALAPLLLNRRLRTEWVFAGYTSAATLLLLSIFTWGIFPDCYVEGAGLTSFKVASEYAICAILLLAIVLLLGRRKALDRSIVSWLVGSMVLTIVSELAFTLYANPYGLANLAGHYLKILAFYCVYRAIIQTGITQPFALLFRDLKQSEERYRSLFTHMINGVARHQIVLDATGLPVDYIFLEVNDAFERITGFERARLIGRRVTEVLPGIEKQPEDWIGTFGRVALKGESIRFERFSGDLQKWFAVTAYSPEAGHFVTVVEDITERKQAEAALQVAQNRLVQANEQLERKVEERTVKLKETIADLEQFSYSIAHDMRAPLRSMSAFASLLLEDCHGKLSDESADYLGRIDSSARRLDLLIRDVLSYAKLARGTVELAPVDLDNLVREIVGAYPCFHPDHAEIEILSPILPVMGNTALLTQSISNLLDNAVKFVPTGTRPRIRLWTESGGNGTVRLLVQDNGIGIEPNHIGRIWKIFERLHHGDQYTGTGIGLSVVQRALDRMNGRVGVESRPGEGSTFWFELPKG